MSANSKPMLPGKPTSRMSRTPMACLRCRGRKVKCIPIENACEGCIKAKKNCEYLSVAAQMKLRGQEITQKNPDTSTTSIPNRQIQTMAIGVEISPSQWALQRPPVNQQWHQAYGISANEEVLPHHWQSSHQFYDTHYSGQPVSFYNPTDSWSNQLDDNNHQRHDTSSLSGNLNSKNNISSFMASEILSAAPTEIRYPCDHDYRNYQGLPNCQCQLVYQLLENAYR